MTRPRMHARASAGELANTASAKQSGSNLAARDPKLADSKEKMPARLAPGCHNVHR